MSRFHEEFKSLQAEREELRKLSEPFRARRDAIAQEIAPLQEEMADLAHHIHAIELPRLAQIDQRLSELAKLMGVDVRSR